MKTIYKILIISLLPYYSYSQIYTRRNTNESIIITPTGLQSNFPNMTGLSNTVLGGDALKSITSGGGNTAIGNAAMGSNTTANYNTAIGSNALFSNTVGGDNVAIGSSSLFYNLKGQNNLAIGTYAMFKNTNAWNNIAIGSFALNNQAFDNGGNTYLSWNIAVGNQALFYNNPTSPANGRINIAIGDDALYNNITGSNNIAIGFQSLYQNTAGFSNIAIGASNLFANQGNSNIAIGEVSLNINSAGNGNVAVGSSTMISNTTGSYNVALGYGALAANTTSNSNIAVGYDALTNYHYASLAGYNIGIGYFALGNCNPDNDSDGNFNTAIGGSGGLNLTTGYYNTFLGYGADVASGQGTIHNAMALGYQAQVNASNKVVIGNASVTTVGGYALWTNYSDRRLKENIVYTDKLGLNFITHLKTATYTYKKDPIKRLRDGLIAQDVQQVLRDLHLEFSGLVEDENAEKTLNLSYGMFVIPLINAVKEQQKTIEVLEAESASQNNEIQAIKERILKLEAKNRK